MVILLEKLLDNNSEELCEPNDGEISGSISGRTTERVLNTFPGIIPEIILEQFLRYTVEDCTKEFS